MPKNPYEALAEKLPSMHPGGLRLTDRAARKAGLCAGMTVLDIGCGCSESAAYLTREYGVTAVGLDISPVLVERAKTRFPDISFFAADARDTRLSPDTFDAVLAECALSVIGDILHKIRSILKPGGLLILSDLCSHGQTDVLKDTLTATGFTVVFSEDHSPALITYAAELHEAGAGTISCGSRDGYILMICKKDARDE